MKNHNHNSVGSMHPVLFFAAVYLVALMLSIFICSSLFYSCNSSHSVLTEGKSLPPAPVQADQPMLAATGR